MRKLGGEECLDDALQRLEQVELGQMESCKDEKRPSMVKRQRVQLGIDKVHHTTIRVDGGSNFVEDDVKDEPRWTSLDLDGLECLQSLLNVDLTRHRFPLQVFMIWVPLFQTIRSEPGSRKTRSLGFVYIMPEGLVCFLAENGKNL